MPLQHNQYRYFVRDALRNYTDDFLPQNAGNPYSFVLNGVPYAVHIFEVQESGANRSPEENRIQFSISHRQQMIAHRDRGDMSAVLGVCPVSSVIFAWEAEHAMSLQADPTASMYGKWAMEDQAKNRVVGVHRFRARYLGRYANSIAFPIDALGVYLENMVLFHRAADSDDTLESLSTSVLSPGFTEAEIHVEGSRELLKATHSRKPRSPQFRQAVMDAYESACCVCGRQLGLVEAAHIIPHAHNDSTDDVVNGIALCVAHHRMYDSALLLPDANGTMRLNSERAEFLRELGLQGGLDEIAELDGQRYRLPDDVNCQPAKDKLQRGYDLRINS